MQIARQHVDERDGADREQHHNQPSPRLAGSEGFVEHRDDQRQQRKFALDVSVRAAQFASGFSGFIGPS